MYTEDDLLPISALQHLAFCERQWALIHLEGMWAENPLTVEGRILHERADETETEVRGNLRTARGLRLRSLSLGLTGRADVVEFHRLSKLEEKRSAQAPPRTSLPLEGASGLWKPFIVEYKRGKPKIDRCDEVQLCAQALCLEEMLEILIPAGALFYGKPRRRYDVAFDESLRKETENLSVRLHELSNASKTPPAQPSKRCKNCSLNNVCLPEALGRRRDVKGYLAKAIEGRDDSS